MKDARTEPITIRIPAETKRVIREICMEQRIDMAEYIRQLIERDLRGKDTVPIHEKKYIERVIEKTAVTQTEQILNFFVKNIVEKVDKIYYNVGTKYDRARCKSEELYAYMEAEYAKINRACPENMDDKIKQYTNEYARSDDWEKTYKIIKNRIDIEVIRHDYLCKSMDYSAEKCKEDGIVNIFAGLTLYDYGQAFNGYITDEKNVNYEDIFERKIKPEIDGKIRRHKDNAVKAHGELIRYAGIETSKIEAEVAAGKEWLQRLMQSMNISETAQRIRAKIKPKSMLSKAIGKTIRLH